MRETGISVRERDAADVHILRYEDLVADPAAAIAGVCAFLGLAYSDQLLEYHREPRLWHGRTSIERPAEVVGTGHNDLRNWQVNQPIFDGRGRWQAELPPRIVARFAEGEPRRIMDAFGYSEG